MKRSSDDPGETDARIPAPSSLLVELIMSVIPSPRDLGTNKRCWTINRISGRLKGNSQRPTVPSVCPKDV